MILKICRRLGNRAEIRTKAVAGTMRSVSYREGEAGHATEFHETPVVDAPVNQAVLLRDPVYSSDSHVRRRCHGGVEHAVVRSRHRASNVSLPGRARRGWPDQLFGLLEQMLRIQDRHWRDLQWSPTEP
jgi:hypothetical protein